MLGVFCKESIVWIYDTNNELINCCLHNVLPWDFVCFLILWISLSISRMNPEDNVWHVPAHKNCIIIEDFINTDCGKKSIDNQPDALEIYI